MRLNLIPGGTILGILYFGGAGFRKLLLVALADVFSNACLHSKHPIGGPESSIHVLRVHSRHVRSRRGN